MSGSQPKYLARPSDGSVWSINEDLVTYSSKQSKEEFPDNLHHEHSYDALINSGFYPVTESDFQRLREIQDEYYKYLSWASRSDGHGDAKGGTIEEFRSIKKNESDNNFGENSLWEDSDGNRISLADVNRYLDEQGVGVTEMDPKLFESILIDVMRDPLRIDNANLHFAIIVISRGGKFTTVLDGQHRVVKCIKNSINPIKVRVLDLDRAPEKFNKMFK